MSDINIGAIRTGGVVADVTLKVGGGIRVGGTKVKGAVEVGNGGGSAPVTEARWGQILGNIENQSDLMAALDTKVSDTELDAYAREIATEIGGKMDTPSGTNGQFMSLVNGVWTAVNLPVYEGGVN